MTDGTNATEFNVSMSSKLHEGTGSDITCRVLLLASFTRESSYRFQLCGSTAALRHLHGCITVDISYLKVQVLTSLKGFSLRSHLHGSAAAVSTYVRVERHLRYLRGNTAADVTGEEVKLLMSLSRELSR